MQARKHGRQWQVSYRCPGHPKLINEYFDSEEEANLRIAQIELDKVRGSLSPPVKFLDPETEPRLLGQRMTVSMLMEQLVTDYGKENWSVNVLRDNNHRIEDYINPLIGDVLIRDLTPLALERFYAKLQSYPAKKTKGHEDDEDKPVAPSVIRKVHSLMSCALSQAVRWGYLPMGQNAAVHAKPPRSKEKERSVWGIAEVKTALAFCQDKPLSLGIRLAFVCSLRIGEVMGLTWDDIEIEGDHGHLHVRKQVYRGNREELDRKERNGQIRIFRRFPSCVKDGSTILVLTELKTESSVRTNPFDKSVVEALQDMREYQARQKADLGAEYQDFNLVVAQENGRPFEERLMRKRFNRLIKEAGLPPVVFHSLRHTSVNVKLQLSGGDIKAVQGDTGHSQARMVTDQYAHIRDDDRRTLAQVVDATVFGDAEKAPPQETSTVAELVQKVEKNPELAEKLLQMLQIMGK